jgi:hypothetical protein
MAEQPLHCWSSSRPSRTPSQKNRVSSSVTGCLTKGISLIYQWYWVIDKHPALASSSSA